MTPLPPEGWPEIAEAPCDGTHLYLFSPDAVEPYIYVGFGSEIPDEGVRFFATWDDDCAVDAQPTHFERMPEVRLAAETLL